MIGEKIKIGFDGKEVKKGLGGIMGGFGKLRRGIGRSMGQVGTGMGRQMGVTLFGTVAKLVTAIPEQINKMSLLRKELDMMRDSTGVTAKEYLALREAMSQKTGKSVDDAAEDIKDITERLGMAILDDGTERKALHALDLKIGDIKGKSPVEQIREISSAFTNFKNKHTKSEAMGLITQLLGDQAGKNLIPFFMDYKNSMAEARIQTKGLTDQLVGLEKPLAGIFQIKVAFGRKLSEFSLGVLQGVNTAMTGISGAGIGSIADWMNSLDIAGFAAKVSGFLSGEIKKMQSADGILGYYKETLASIGKWISEMISKGINAGIDLAMENPKIAGLIDTISRFSGGGGGLLGGLFGGNKNKDTSADAINNQSAKELKAPSNAKVEDNTKRTNEILLRMQDKGVLAFWGA